jgi:predicted transcriptional regulator
MTGIQAMRDYISCTSRPFTSLQVVAELGLCYETVKKYLQDFISEGYVKKIGVDKGKNVYIHNKHNGEQKQYQVKNKHYTLEAIQETYRRQIAKRRELFDDLL